MITCLIIEDEVAAREILVSFVRKTPFLKLNGVYESGLEVPHSAMKEVDLLFLDIQLPELNGLSFLKTIVNPPQVIITTAFSNYAVEAFEVAVIDYLMKPFSYERFFKAVTRVRDKFHTQNNKGEQFIYLYADKVIHKVYLDEILYLKGEVDYVRFVLSNRNILVLDSLKNFAEQLKENDFVQIHKSYIVNFSKMKQVSSIHFTIGNYELPIGKTYRNSLMKILDKD